jgi:hypothetical protein
LTGFLNLREFSNFERNQELKLKLFSKMEAELVEKISRVTEFSEDMANILTAINRDIYRAGWNPYIQKLASVLLNNVSHPKITSMKKTASVIINVNNQTKSLEEYCLDLILQILLKIIK